MSQVSPVRRTATAVLISGGLAAGALSAAAGPALAKSSHGPRTTHAATTRSVAPTSSASPAETVNANFYAGDFAIQFNAQRAGAAADQATGFFSAQGKFGTSTVASLSGPVTCLDENGPYIGLFYPLTGSSPAALGTLIKGVYVSVELGRTGQPVSMSFRPSEVSGVSSCAPAPGLIPILSGTVTEGS